MRYERMFASGFSSLIDEITALEIEARRIAARQADLLAELDRTGAFTEDGHASAKTMVRHVGRLASASASSRERISRAMRDLPELASAFRAGEIGVDQMDLIGRIHRNGRVRLMLIDAQDWFVDLATSTSFKTFETTAREWERLADEDGPQPNERMHRARRVKLDQDDTTLVWELSGRFASMMGAQIADIFDHYKAAELAVDWEKARANHGEDACDLHLPRTADQRSADALWQVFQDAASADSSCVPPDFCHNVLWSSASYEEMVRRLDGEAAEPVDPDDHRCETQSGTPLEPYEAAAHSLLTQVRRVLIDQTSTVIDLGRARAFTGNSRRATKLQATECIWPGCHVPVDRCQLDHTRPHRSGGRTHPGNGAPACGRHNRLKEHGYRVWRDPAGRWHTYRPDGTEIPD